MQQTVDPMPLSSGRKGSNRIWTEKSFRRWKCRRHLQNFTATMEQMSFWCLTFLPQMLSMTSAIGKIRDICQCIRDPGDRSRKHQTYGRRKKTDLCRLCQGCI